MAKFKNSLKVRITEGTPKTTSSRITFVPQEPQEDESETEREKGAEELFEEIIYEMFLNLGKETDIHIQQAQRVPNKVTQREPHHIKTCILSRVKQITSPGWMHETSAWGWCIGKTQRDGMGREAGGGIGMGNTWLIHANGKNHYNIVK